MHCAGCAGTVQKALAGVAGVSQAGVNYAGGGAVVTIDPGKVSRRRLVEAVRHAGYDIADDARSDDEREARAWRGRALIGLVCAAPLMLFMFIPSLHGHTWRPWVEMALAAVVQIFVGGPFMAGLWKGLRHGRANMDTLVAGGSLIAFCFSAWEVIASIREGRMFHGFFEVGAFILAFVTVGKWLEARARRSASSAVRALMELAPETVAVRRGHEEVNIPLDQVRPGDLVVVRPGGRIPVDGQVIEGSAAVDESSVTGEPMPVDKAAGDLVTSGTLSTNGALVFSAMRVGADTVLARVVAAVEQAQSSKAPVQRLADAVSAVFVPVVLVLAVIASIGWWIWTGRSGEVDWGLGIRIGVAVLVVSCPCALGLATPAAVVTAMGAAARRGVLIRDAQTLEALASVDAVVFDKTGTLTAGKPTVSSIIAMDGHDRTEVLRLAASVEALSEHPLARAIVREASAQELPLAACEGFSADVGVGVRGIVAGRRVSIERPAEHEADGQVIELRRGGATVVRVRIDDRDAALIALRDAPRPAAREAVTALKAMGLAPIMLTGDHEVAARAVAGLVAIDAVRAGVAPQGKADAITEIESSGRRAAMVGDGINDAPALARATVGIAMGSGTDAAIASAGIVLMRPDPGLVAEAIALAGRARAIIRQNLVLALVYNAAMIPLAMLGIIHPVLASAAMALSSISVVGNALRLR